MEETDIIWFGLHQTYLLGLGVSVAQLSGKMFTVVLGNVVQSSCADEFVGLVHDEVGGARLLLLVQDVVDEPLV